MIPTHKKYLQRIQSLNKSNKCYKVIISVTKFIKINYEEKLNIVSMTKYEFVWHKSSTSFRSILFCYRKRLFLSPFNFPYELTIALIMVSYLSLSLIWAPEWWSRLIMRGNVRRYTLKPLYTLERPLALFMGHSCLSSTFCGALLISIFYSWYNR